MLFLDCHKLDKYPLTKRTLAAPNNQIGSAYPMANLFSTIQSIRCEKKQYGCHFYEMVFFH
jgi:hypothetical protein